MAKRIAIVGEAWSESEALLKAPFVGAAGQELRKMLKEANIDINECFLTNVFNLRPDKNDLSKLCIRKDATSGALGSLKLSQPELPWPSSYIYPPLLTGKYLDPIYLPELWRLKREIEAQEWDVVIALGNTPLWALCGVTGITKLRGYYLQSSLCPGVRVFPTYHPAHVLRQWAIRSIVISDLIKSQRGESQRIARELCIEPSLSDIREFHQWLEQSGVPFTIDIETRRGQITCIGFGTTRRAISISFWDRRTSDWSYWSSVGDEIAAWELTKQILSLPNDKIFQNGLFDLQYIWRVVGLRVNGVVHDTMLVHHALQPEMQKDLNFLGSTYTDEFGWKGMRKMANLKKDSEKRED